MKYKLKDFVTNLQFINKESFFKFDIQKYIFDFVCSRKKENERKTHKYKMRKVN